MANRKLFSLLLQLSIEKPSNFFNAVENAIISFISGVPKQNKNIFFQDRVEGNIGFKNAEFCYPTRQQVNVLKSLNLSLTPGEQKLPIKRDGRA
jgi:hypothetical protein